MDDSKFCITERVALAAISLVVIVIIIFFTEWKENRMNDILKIALIALLVGLNLGVNAKKKYLDWIKKGKEEENILRRDNSATKLTLGMI